MEGAAFRLKMNLILKDFVFSRLYIIFIG